MDADFPETDDDGLVPRKEPGPPVERCGTCGEPLVRRGEQRACVRCLAQFAAFDEEEADAVPTPTNRYGQFELLFNEDGSPAELGRGAMGATYRAHDTVLHRTVALKVIGAALAAHPEARERFLREARAAARFQHPNVAAVSQYGEQDGECFYAMELVEGETLEARVAREGPLPVGETLEIVSQVARALAAAETRGIIHRDLKPTNLMLAKSDEAGAGPALLVKVIDFGLAKAVSAATDPAGGAGGTRGFLGTPSFASPEQFAGAEDGKIDHRSDIYALGATTWYALTGRVPFVGSTLDEIRSRQHDPLPLAQLAARKVPRRVVGLLASMLAADPADRPQSARELLEKLACCQKDARPPAKRTNRWIFAAPALALLAAGGIWWSQRPPGLKPGDRSLAVLPFENASPRLRRRFLHDRDAG